MFDELQYIKLSGKEYPIKCDLLVVEKIQEKYESIDDFENGLLTWELVRDEAGNIVYEEKEEENKKPKARGRFPKMECVNDALFWFVCEGEAIAAEIEHRAPERISREKIVRSVDISIIKLANLLYDEFFRCFSLKNLTTTQKTEKKTE